MRDTDKITMTLGQLKRLIKESLVKEKIMTNLDSIPQSHRAFFVKKVTQYPSGFGRSCPMHYDEPRYYVMKRPVDSKGNRDSWFNDGKVKEVAGPFIGEEGKRKAEKIAQERNESWHSPLN